MTLAGYFQKAVISLINKQGQLWEFIKSYTEIRENLLKHIQVRAIADIIARLITLDGVENVQYQQFQAERKLLVSDIFEIYLQSQEEEVLENISMIFFEVIQTLQQSDKNPGKFFESVAEEIYRTERI